MTAPSMPVAPEPLRVLHVLRAPLGGLFRHVFDLAEGQAAAGLAVGVIMGEEPRDPIAMARAQELAARCSLGTHVVPMRRMPGLGDGLNLLRLAACTRGLRPDIIHGHGAKGGAYVRLLPGFVGGMRVYTPHGGALHFDPRTIQGMAFFAAERLMRRWTDGFIFESDFGLRMFTAKIGEPSAPSIVIRNGVREEEFAPVERAADAADFVFVGELRMLKGVGTLIEAVSSIRTPVRICIVGSGSDRAVFEDMARKAPAHVRIEFKGAMPAREAFALGRVVVLPSHHESLPYVALEAAAAGMPLIATRVGGIPEIFGPDAGRLVSPGVAHALAAALVGAISDREDMARLAERLRVRVHSGFSVTGMVGGVIEFYRGLREPALIRQPADTAQLPIARMREGLPR